MNLETQVLEVFNKATTPLYPKDIANQLGISVQKASYVIIQLCKKGVISSKVIDPIHGTRVWELSNNPNPAPPPEPDREHEEWLEEVLTKKPVYNPR